MTGSKIKPSKQRRESEDNAGRRTKGLQLGLLRQEGRERVGEPHRPPFLKRSKAGQWLGEQMQGGI